MDITWPEISSLIGGQKTDQVGHLFRGAGPLHWHQFLDQIRRKALSLMGDSMIPGAITFTVILREASSRASGICWRRGVRLWQRHSLPAHGYL